MEPQQTSEQRSSFSVLQQVTPLSKYLAMLVFVIMPFIGGYIGYVYSPQKIVERVKVVPLKNLPPTMVPKSLKEATPNEVIDAYMETDYRVVSVVLNPFYSDKSQYDQLVIMTPRGINDYACGGRYVPPVCYIFLESSYANTITPVFVGTWNGGLLQTDTVAFVSPTEISFDVANGDAGYGYRSTYRYDLMTGSSTRTAHQEFSFE